MKSQLGTFNVVSGRIIVSDPCYEAKNELQLPAVNGEWKASISGKDRNSVLNVSTKGSSKFPWEKVSTAGVDSGQMSVFDLSAYRNDKEAEGRDLSQWKPDKGAGEQFYAACCVLTCYAENSAGVLPHGAVSQSGYGDGVYPVYVKKNEQGKVVAVKVKF